MPASENSVSHNNIGRSALAVQAPVSDNRRSRAAFYDTIVNIHGPESFLESIFQNPSRGTRGPDVGQGETETPDNHHAQITAADTVFMDSVTFPQLCV